jgi:hypothetical protein
MIGKTFSSTRTTPNLGYNRDMYVFAFATLLSREIRYSYRYEPLLDAASWKLRSGSRLTTARRAQWLGARDSMRQGILTSSGRTPGLATVY